MTEFYKKYMKSEKWQYKRAQRLEMDNYKCTRCGRPASTCKGGLQIHHTTYERLGDEDVEHDLISLCPRCHLIAHGKLKPSDRNRRKNK